MSSGLLKLSGVLSVLLLAALGLLLLFGLIPFEKFQTLTVKGLAVIAILGTASLAIGVLVKIGKTDKS